MNVFDYLDWRGDLPMDVVAFNELDGVILARFSYLPFERLPESFFHQPVTVTQTAQALLADPELDLFLRNKNDRSLLTALSDSVRFGRMEMIDFVNQLDKASETQFAAITVRIAPDRYGIVFRGTDNTLVGWKEDFNMSFVCPVPAQELAVSYLDQAAACRSGELIVAGHSKGGNLAVYAAAFCSPAVQERIRQVYNYDGPGFDDKVLQREEYKRMCDKVRTFVPQSSVVGMLLGHEEQYTIVHSQQVGIFQHDIYTWDINSKGFCCLETVNNSSRFVNYTLKAWIAGMDYEQREKFIDAVYLVMTETNASTLKELGENWFANARTVLRSAKNLDEETKQAVAQALHLLMKSTGTGLSQILQKE